MTAIVGVFGLPATTGGVLVRMLRDARRGVELFEIAGDDDARFVASRHLWERHPGHGGSCATFDDGECVVAADATLYHAETLRDAVRARGVRPASSGVCQLIVAAYRAWGEECVRHLEGDFAFVIWDRRRRRVLAARDFAGRRVLYFVETGNALLVASAIQSLAAHPAVRAELNPMTLGADAAGLIFSTGNETSLLGVRALEAGHALSWTPGAPSAASRFWHPEFAPSNPASFDDAAEELRSLLVESAGARLSTSGATSVWMSGGRDSTAVYVAGRLALAARGHGGPLFPISRSHPQGDSGREDEAISSIATFWGTTPHWVDARDVRMFEQVRGRAADRAEAFAQPFESLTRSLAGASWASGSRVALDGFGGDFLFQVSPVFLADLLVRGRLGALLAEWRGLGNNAGVRDLIHWSLKPLMPPWAFRAAQAMRGGRPLGRHLERTAPAWIRGSFLRDHGLVERARAADPSSYRGRYADRETAWMLCHPYFARVNAMMGQFALEHGVELRSPLYDRRVVEFALRRPREERNTAGDRKRLLRHAMRGLLPDAVLAPRRVKTGTLATYFVREMRTFGAPLLAEIAQRPRLAELGIVEPAALRSAVEEFRTSGVPYERIEELYFTLQAELWLHARYPTAGPAVLWSGERPDTINSEGSCTNTTEAKSTSSHAWSDSARFAS